MSALPVRTTYFTALSQGSATPAPEDDVFSVVRYPADWIEDGVVPLSDEDVKMFIRSNFEADPEITLTDEFESMVDEV